MKYTRKTLLDLTGMNFCITFNFSSDIVVGTMLGVYEDNRFKSDSKKTLLKAVDIIGLGSGPELDRKLKYASDVYSGVIFGKELVNAPANVLTPGLLEFMFYIFRHFFNPIPLVFFFSFCIMI